MIVVTLVGISMLALGDQSKATDQPAEGLAEIRVEDRQGFTRVIFPCTHPEACSVEPDLERYRFIVRLPEGTRRIVPPRLAAGHPLVRKIAMLDGPGKERGVEVVLTSPGVDWISYRYDEPPRTVLYLRAQPGTPKPSAAPSKPPDVEKETPAVAKNRPPGPEPPSEPRSPEKQTPKTREIDDAQEVKKVEDEPWRPSAKDIPEFFRLDPAYPPDFQVMKGDERDLYQQALERYRARDFSGARALASRIVPREQKSALAETLAFLKADCEFRSIQTGNSQNYLKAIQTYQEAMTQFSHSAFMPQARLSVGLGYRRLGFFQEALVQYQLYMKQFPEGPHIREAEFWCGECLFQKKKYEEAKGVFRRFARRFPQSIHGRIAALRVGDCLYKTGDVKGAREQYGVVLSESSDLSCYPVGSLRLAGLSFLKNGDFQKGREILFRAVNLDPEIKDAGQMMDDIAHSYLEEHRDHEALRVSLLLCDAFGEQDVGARGWVRLADIRLSRPGLKWPPLCEDACLNPIGVYQKVLNQCRDMGLADEFMYRKSLALVKQGDWQEAAATLKKIVSQRQKDALRERSASLLAYCLNMLIRRHHGRGEHVESIRLYRKYRDFLQDEGNIEQAGLMVVAESFQQLGLQEEALDVYRLIQGKNRGIEDHVLFQIARLLIRKGNKEEARETLELLHSSFPNSGYVPHAQRLLGDLCLDLKDHKAATTWYRRTLARMGSGPDTGRLRVRLGRALRQSGRHREAMAAYGRGVAEMWSFRGQTWAKEALGETLAEMAEYCENRGKTGEALAYYTKIVRLAPSADQVDWALYQLGEGHRRIGNMNRMQEVFEELKNRSPDSLWAKLADWSRGHAAFRGEAGPYLARAEERLTRKQKE
jgi:TolA-binding protein